MNEFDVTHREFLLSAMRAASLRLKAWDADLTTIGIALKGDMVTAETALEWLQREGMLWVLGPLPQSMGKTFLPTIETEQD